MLDQSLNQKIENRSATIAILGLGYVGLPLAMLFSKVGFKVIGYDVDNQYVRSLNFGVSRILDVPSKELQSQINSGRFYATYEFNELRNADIYLICVPTPLSKSRQPDLSYIESAVNTLLKVWEPEKLVVLESTTYPGTTDEYLLGVLGKGGLEIDKDFLLAFSPERVDPGNASYQLRQIPKVVGGVTAASGMVARSLYATIFDKVHLVSNARAAELSKLLENTFRNVNIALVNEFDQICNSLGVSVWEVIEAAKTKPFGFMPFYPGPGIGGHCIPLDPQYLVYKARLSGYEPRLVALADQINQERPRYIVHLAMELLNQLGKPLNNSKILVMGVAYKPNVPDTRESPAFTILEELLKRGANISYTDPYAHEINVQPSNKLYSIKLDVQQLEEADLIIVVTAHDSFDYKLLDTFSAKVLDTRNVLPLATRLENNNSLECKVQV